MMIIRCLLPPRKHYSCTFTTLSHLYTLYIHMHTYLLEYICKYLSISYTSIYVKYRVQHARGRWLMPPAYLLHSPELHDAVLHSAYRAVCMSTLQHELLYILAKSWLTKRLNCDSVNVLRALGHCLLSSNASCTYVYVYIVRLIVDKSARMFISKWLDFKMYVYRNEHTYVFSSVND